jgi:hypothetical protein
MQNSYEGKECQGGRDYLVGTRALCYTLQWEEAKSQNEHAPYLEEYPRLSREKRIREAGRKWAQRES